MPFDQLHRRDFITLLGGAAAWPLSARGQQRERMRRIAAVMSMAANDPEAQPRVAAFESGLRELGWLDGRNLRIEYRWVSDGDLLRRNAAELAGMPPDLILATSTPVMAALQEQGVSVPIVFVQVTDPVGQGLVSNLARPGGHITGFTNFEFSIGTKWLEALKQIAPRVTRVALIFNLETAPYAGLFQRPVEAAAPAFAVTPVAVAVRTAAELERAVGAFAGGPTGGLIVLPDVTNLIHRDQIIALAARHRLPAVYPYRYYAASGGLLSYGSEQADVFRRASSYVDRILKGTSPGELPVQAPTKYELVINLKTAKELGLEVPATLLARADELSARVPRLHCTPATKSPDRAGALRRAQRPHCLAGHVGLELRNVATKYPFEKPSRFPTIQPNPVIRDGSRLSCGVADTANISMLDSTRS